MVMKLAAPHGVDWTVDCRLSELGADDAAPPGPVKPAAYDGAIEKVFLDWPSTSEPIVKPAG